MKDQTTPQETDPLLPDSGDEKGEPKETMLPSAVQHRKSRSVDFARPPPSARREQRFGGLHRRHASSISHLQESLRNLRAGLEPIREDVLKNAKEVGRVFVHELDKFDQGQVGFYDMSMTRSLSVLPEDIPDLAEEVVGAKLTPETVAGPPLVQYLALVAAVLAISSNATALHLLEGVTAPLKLYWRMTASYLVLSVFAFRAVYKEGIPTLSFGQWLIFGSATFCYSVHSLLFFTALEFTAIGNVLILANSQALLLIIGKFFVGEPIHFLERNGVFVAFSGAAMCTKDAESASSEQSGGHVAGRALLGDVLALCAAALGVGYLTLAKAVRSKMPISVFLFSAMFCGSFLVLLYILMDDDLEVELSFDPNIGMFGWWNWSRVPILIYLAVVVNLVGTLGFVRAMAFFDTMIIAIATLAEPMLASFIAHAFGIGNLPGYLGWVGNTFVACGTLAVVYPSMHSGKSLH